MSNCKSCGRKVGFLQREQVYNEDTGLYDSYCYDCYHKQKIESDKVKKKVIEIRQENNKEKAIEILQKRLARGEITLEEFHDLVQRL